MDKELKGNTFCPPNVVAITLPAPVEFPSVPLAPNDDRQAVTGAGIGKGLVVSYEQVERNGDGGLGVKSVQPPVEFSYYAVWFPTWHEQVATEDSQH